VQANRPQARIACGAVLRKGTGDRKVRTCEELQAVLAERGPASLKIPWLDKSLLHEAQRLWKIMPAHSTI